MRVPSTAERLQSIEDDHLDELPGDVFARGFLKSYASTVGLDEDDVLERFSRRSEKPDAEADVAPAPITAVTPPESGRRFGIAIALVILLILFTLALSIVLRPRQRDTPIELSSLDTPALLVDSGLVDSLDVRGSLLHSSILRSRGRLLARTGESEAAAGVFQRGNTLPVADVDIGAGGNQYLYGFAMIRPAIT